MFDAVRTSTGKFVALASDFDVSDNTGEPPSVVLTSSDGVTWTRIDFDTFAAGNLAVSGATVFLSTDTGDLSESTDDGHTWAGVTDAAGDAVSGSVIRIGNKIVAVGGDVNGSLGPIYWVGTPGQ